MTRTIILAHGLFGFGNYFGLPLPDEAPIQYFRDVKEHLALRVDHVLEPQVDPTGSVKLRGRQLGAVILAAPEGRVDIIAHSMGGLDARYALANVAGVRERVTSLVMIGTPHHGSPWADALANPLDGLRFFLPSSFRRHAEAFHDLTTEAAAGFNAATPDVAGVRYLNIAGDGTRDRSFFYPLAVALETAGFGKSDGIVTQSSAYFEGHAGHKKFAEWPLDHAAQLGWRLEVQPVDYLALYDAIVDEMGI